METKVKLFEEAPPAPPISTLTDQPNGQNCSTPWPVAASTLNLGAWGFEKVSLLFPSTVPKRVCFPQERRAPWINKHLSLQPHSAHRQSDAKQKEDKLRNQVSGGRREGWAGEQGPAGGGDGSKRGGEESGAMSGQGSRAGVRDKVRGEDQGLG